MHEIWQVGNFKITRIVELEVTGGTRFILPDATRDRCLEYRWMHPHFMDDQGNLIMSIHALVVDTGSRRIVVDTCIGNDKERSIPTWSNLQTNFLEDLEASGYPPHTIDTVLCTHLHVDHVGWNTRLVDGDWVPTFPNATYLIHEKEWEYWNLSDESNPGDDILGDSVRPVIDAGLCEFVREDHEVAPGVQLLPTPGHTPGHVSVLVSSNGKNALITGDCIHHPVQMSRVDWCSSADTDSQQGLETRQKLLADLVDSNTLVIGTHFASPTAGYVKRLTDVSYWFDVAES